MIAQWIADLRCEMYKNRITSLRLASAVGWHPKYLSAVFNGRRAPKNAEKELRAALKALLDSRE